ncbi:unnamed protein product [Haemonchus placei]|uniref:Transcriptional regulator n=1 Tax=Haemonchus placei TaxID=6290 RepID=A0A158QQ84_HAEPC|nr:unnamed protein product [Haemonchus placei]
MAGVHQLSTIQSNSVLTVIEASRRTTMKQGSQHLL